MPSLYDLLVSPDPQTEAAALQDALRKRAARGSVLQMTGDRVLAPAGSGMLEEANQGQAGMVNVMGSRLKQAMEAQRAKAAEAAKMEGRAYHEGRQQLSWDAAMDRARVQAGYKRAEESAKEEKETEKALRMGPSIRILPSSPFMDAPATQKIDFTTNVVGSAQDLATNSKALEDLIARYGTGRLTEKEARTAMKSKVAIIRSNLKALLKLGVIGGADMPQFVDPQIEDPTQVQSVFNDWFGGLGKTDYPTQLRELRKTYLGNVKRQMDTLGLVPEGELAETLDEPFGGAKAKEPALGTFDKAAVRKERIQGLKALGKSATEILQALKAEGLTE
jgi:hypothetical protein